MLARRLPVYNRCLTSSTLRTCHPFQRILHRNLHTSRPNMSVQTSSTLNIVSTPSEFLFIDAGELKSDTAQTHLLPLDLTPRLSKLEISFSCLDVFPWIPRPVTSLVKEMLRLSPSKFSPTSRLSLKLVVLNSEKSSRLPYVCNSGCTDVHVLIFDTSDARFSSKV